MRFTTPTFLRRASTLVAVASTVCVSLTGASIARAATTPLSISIVGNHFHDGSGHTIRLLGVNHTSAEYACVDGYGYDDGHFTGTDAAAIAAWHANAVRVPLNEDCWLGINGQPNSNQGADPKLTVTGYRNEIKNYVADLNRHGIYAILDLHWTAPGSQVALEQQPMPDTDHSPAFWTSVATTFKSNHAVVFDLFNEPYDPTDPKSGDDATAADKVSWNCWETGTHDGPDGGTPCYTAAYDENNNKTTTYRIAGLQTLLDAVRTAGAKQPVMAGGLDYANDLGVSDHGQAWMTHAPDDPLNQEAASFHNYMGKACDTATCWKNSIAPVAKHVPVVTGEFDEDNFLERKCTVKTKTTFDAQYMNWADSAGVSYVAWGWIVDDQATQDADGCSSFSLITNYTKYTPAKPNGVAVHDHLVALWKRTHQPPPVSLTTFRASVQPGATKVVFGLGSPENCTGTLTGKTIRFYTTGTGKAHQVALGTAYFKLTAHKVGAVTLTLSSSAHALLVKARMLKVQITTTLTSPEHRKTTVNHTIVLKVP